MLGIGLEFHTEHLSPLAPNHRSDFSTDGRGKANFRVLLVHKQRFAGFHPVAFLDNNLGRHSLKVVWNKCKLAIRLQLDSLFQGLAFKTDV